MTTVILQADLESRGRGGAAHARGAWGVSPKHPSSNQSGAAQERCLPAGRQAQRRGWAETRNCCSAFIAAAPSPLPKFSMLYSETMALPHEFHAGADVYTSDDKKVGTLHRVVLRRPDLALTHIVVDVGFLRSGHALWEGLGREYDRVVPIEAVQGASDKRVNLRLAAAAFREAPEYTDESFEQPHDLMPGRFDIPDLATRVEAVAAAISRGAFWIVEKLNKSPNEVDIKEGTPVWRQEPHEKLGEVDRVLIDPQTGRTTAFVIRRGFLSKRDVVLPVRYLAEVFDDLLHVDISDADLDGLREYDH